MRVLPYLCRIRFVSTSGDTRDALVSDTDINISRGLSEDSRVGAVVALHYQSGMLYCATKGAVFRVPFRKMSRSIGKAVPVPAFRLGRRGATLRVESRLGAVRVEIRDLRGTLLAAENVPTAGGPVEFRGLPGSTLIVTGSRADGTRTGSALVPGGFR